MDNQNIPMGNISSQEGLAESRIPPDQYYSVEFSLPGHTLPYQFKIWYIGRESMCLLVKAQSKIIESIKVGDVLNMKYYSADALNYTRDIETEIRQIIKEDNGRFKGHFLIGLALLGY
jgi:hypothetical protein